MRAPPPAPAVSASAPHCPVGTAGAFPGPSLESAQTSARISQVGSAGTGGRLNDRRSRRHVAPHALLRPDAGCPSPPRGGHHVGPRQLPSPQPCAAARAIGSRPCCGRGGTRHGAGPWPRARCPGAPAPGSAAGPRCPQVSPLPLPACPPRAVVTGQV